MGSVSTLRSLLPGAEMGPDASTPLTGGGYSSSRKLVRGLSLLSFPSIPTSSTKAPMDEEAPVGSSQAFPATEAPTNSGTLEAVEAGGLIPGLLDEVALICLACLPSSEWHTARQVCSAWRKLFCTQERTEILTPLRRKLLTLEHWVFVMSAQTTRDTPWRAIELGRGLTRTVPPMLGSGSRYSWTGAGVAAAGCKLVVLGWKDDNIYAFTGSIFPASLSSFLWVYCPVLNTWAQKKGVPSPRTHFACTGDGEKVYVAGGRRGGSIMEQGELLTTAWVYHLEQDRWESIADMCRPCDHGRAVVVGGRVWVFGGPDRTAQVYDPGTKAWALIENMWPWPISASLCAVTVYQGSIVMVDITGQDILQYSQTTNEWCSIAHIRGFSQPIDGLRQLCSLESDGEHLYILGGYLDAAYAAYGVNDIEAWDPANGWVAKRVEGLAPIGSTMASALVAL